MCDNKSHHMQKKKVVAKLFLSTPCAENIPSPIMIIKHGTTRKVDRSRVNEITVFKCMCIRSACTRYSLQYRNFLLHTGLHKIPFFILILFYGPGYTFIKPVPELCTFPVSAAY